MLLSKTTSFGIQLLRRIFYYFVSTGRFKGKPLLRQPLYYHIIGKVYIGDEVVIGEKKESSFYSTCCYLDTRDGDASITLSDGVKMNNSVSIIAKGASIYIGKRCLIGSNVHIYSSDFHALSPDERLNQIKPKCENVVIGDDVFIGKGAIILKGSRIGSGCVVPAGAVVAGEHKPNSIVKGFN